MNRRSIDIPGAGTHRATPWSVRPVGERETAWVRGHGSERIARWSIRPVMSSIAGRLTRRRSRTTVHVRTVTTNVHQIDLCGPRVTPEVAGPAYLATDHHSSF